MPVGLEHDIAPCLASWKCLFKSILFKWLFYLSFSFAAIVSKKQNRKGNLQIKKGEIFEMSKLSFAGALLSFLLDCSSQNHVIWLILLKIDDLLGGQLSHGITWCHLSHFLSGALCACVDKCDVQKPGVGCIICSGFTEWLGSFC